MADGLQTTLKLLAQTDNEASVNVLIAALDATDMQIQEEALRALLKRRSHAGGREILQRLHTADPSWQNVLSEFTGRMTAALRDAVLSSDPQTSENACRAILWFGEFDLTPVLITAAEDASNPNADRSAATLLDLADQLYEELIRPRDYKKRRDPKLIRQHVVSSLELSLQRYSHHQRRELVEACLVLEQRDSPVLRSILEDPRHSSYLAVIEALRESQRPGIVRLMLSFLDDAHAPSAAIKILSHRTDQKFIGHLLRKAASDLSGPATHNLKRVEHFTWLRDRLDILGSFTEEEQRGAIQLVATCGISRTEAFSVLHYLFQHGGAESRRTAIAALETYRGSDANRLTVQAMDDDDPEVQAEAVKQLRPRAIPGAMSHLITLVESPHEVIQKAAREALKEFSFDRYLGAFDMMEEHVRLSTGQLVKKIDPETLPGLQREFDSPSRTRQLKAIEATVALGCVAEMEAALLEQLAAGDHIVRASAAQALGESNGVATLLALQEALADRSVSVSEAARESIKQITTRVRDSLHASAQQSGASR